MNLGYAIKYAAAMLGHAGSAGRWQRACLVAFVATALLGAIVCLFNRRYGRVCAWLALLAATLGLALAFQVVEGARLVVEQTWPVAPLPEYSTRSWASLTFAGAALAAGALPLAFVWLRCLPGVAARVLVSVACGLAGATAFWTLVALEPLAGWISHYWDTFDLEYVRGGFAQHRLRVEGGYWLLAGVMLAGAVIGLPALLREMLDGERRLFGVRGRAACVVLFLTGAVLFWKTRSFAHDARRPLSPTDPLRSCVLDSTELEALPMAGKGCQLAVAPTVEVSAGRLWLDGRKMADEQELLAELRQYNERWRKLHPHPSEHRLYPLVVAAAVAEPVEALASVERAALRAGFDRVGRLERLPRETAHTRTLGELPRTPRCCVSFE